MCTEQLTHLRRFPTRFAQQLVPRLRATAPRGRIQSSIDGTNGELPR